MGSNECPAGSSVITDEAQCQAAAATAGKVWAGSVNGPAYPRGCYWVTININSNVLLNTHPTGGAYQYDQPLCAVAATGARARVLGCARAPV